MPTPMKNTENVASLEQLFCYFDGLIELDCDDQLFASSYLRGFLEVAATEFGHQQQPLSLALYSRVDKQILAAQDELSAPDQAIVIEFWHEIKPMFSYSQ